MSDPTSGDGDGERAREVEPSPPSLEPVIRRRSAWPVLGVIAVLAAAAAGGVIWWRKRPDPLRVIVAVEIDGAAWEGSRPAAALSDALGEQLREVGLEPIDPGDPEVEAVLEKAGSIDEAATALRAQFVIEGTLAPQVIEHPVASGFFEVRVDAPLRVREAGATAPLAETRLAAWAGARTKDDALRLLGESVADRVFEATVPGIVGHPAVASLLESDEITTIQRLEPAKRYVEARTTRLDRARRAWAKADEDHAPTPSDPRPIRYHGHFGADDALGGVTTGGALVRTADRLPMVSARTAELLFYTELERLVVRPDEGEDRVLWSGYHLFSYPSATPSGSHVLFVEDLFGWAKTLTVIHDGAERRVRVEPEARFVEPTISPDGGAAAVYVRACRRCPSVFTVLSLVDGKTVYDRAGGAPPREDGEGPPAEGYGGFAWLDATRVALFVAPAPTPTDDGSFVSPPMELRVVDVAKKTDEVLFRLEEGERCDHPSASGDGALLVAHCESGIAEHVAAFDLAKKERASTGVAGRAPSLSPDGKRCAFVSGSDISLFALDDRAVVALTKNRFHERSPVFSPDGKRVYFESLQDDPNDPRRTTMVVASVEAP